MEILFFISVGLVLYTYAVYPLLLAVADKLLPSRSREISPNEDWPEVSLLVSAFNEEKVIREKLENFLSIDYPKEKMEIVIASDGSEDKTNEIVKEYTDKGITLLDYQQRSGKVNVLNKTVPHLKHEIVIFSDGNTMFQPDAIKKLVRHFQDPVVGCVCGALEFVNAEGTKIGDLEGVYWRLETFMKKSEGRRGCLLGANGGNYALRKSLFYQCPPDTIIEDFVVPMKILQQNYQVIYEPEAIAIEEAALSVSHERQRRIRIGAGDFQALFRLAPMLNPFKGFSSIAFWSHKVIRWITPFLMIIALATHISLLTEPFYQYLFIPHIAFYLAALIGGVFNSFNIHIRLFNLCYYFVAMNWSLLQGFFRFVRNTQKVTWLKTER